MPFRAVLKFFCIFFLATISVFSLAQSTGTVRGTITDPDDALIPGAVVTLTPASGGKGASATSGSDGTYTLKAAPGAYSLTVTMDGFGTVVKQGVRVGAGAVTVDAKMAVEVTQQVQVSTTAQALSVDSDSNASSMVLKGADLDALSDDPDELSDELSALAGPAAGPNGGQIYVDGFTGGQLPPKSSIREIRINQNPFSAQYDRLGFGRVEIFTKPGTDKYHGQVQMNGNDSSFNTLNPFLANTYHSPYHTLFAIGSLSGPLTKVSSYSVNFTHRTIQDVNSFVGSIYVPTAGSPYTSMCAPGLTGVSGCVAVPQYITSVLFPQGRNDLSARLDLAVTPTNTLTIRYGLSSNSATNSGVGNLALPTTGINTTSLENTVQISDTQIISEKVINETRFEYQRDNSTTAVPDPGKQINVSGSFTGGTGGLAGFGANTGNSSDHQTHVEVQNYTSVQLTKNFVRFGGRLRWNHDANYSNSGTFGTFSYASLTDPCVGGSVSNCFAADGTQITANSTPCTASYTMASGSTAHVALPSSYRSYQCNLPYLYSITNYTKNSIDASIYDIGLYAEDDWKIQPNLSLSYGIRFETQSRISDHADIAPRISLAKGIFVRKGTPRTVIRAGFGIFYDRFMLANLETAVRNDPTNPTQRTYSYQYPGSNCTPLDQTGCPTGGTGSTGQFTTTAIGSNLRSPYTLQTAIGFDQQLGKSATLSVNYLNARGNHQFITENVNAPYSTGLYPDGKPIPAPGQPLSETIQNQYHSNAAFEQNQLIANFNFRYKFLSLNGFNSLNFAHSNTGGITSTPSVPYNLHLDYGRASFDIRDRVFVQGSAVLPFKIQISPLLVFNTGSPYDVEVGSDINQDGNTDDRPEFLAGRNSANCKDATSFDIPPVGTQYGNGTNTPIPINYCTGPNAFTLNLRINKVFGFGPRTGPAALQGGGGPDGGGPGGGGGGGGRGGGGGGRGGGGFGGGGGGRGGRGGGGGMNSGRKYTLAFGAQIFNVFNRVNYASESGILTSPNFGKSTQLAGSGGSGGGGGAGGGGGLFSTKAAVQHTTLTATFTF